jgi:hypothetical protein
MNLQVARPRVGELVFHLYNRPLHPEIFEVYAERRLVREKQNVHVRITRSGHVVTWERNDVWITEVAAASSDALPDNSLLQHRIRGEQFGQVMIRPDIRYQMSSQVETLPWEIYLHIHDEILADGARRGILFNFQPNHRLALAPLGFLTIEGNARSLVIQAFHTFPEECTVVKSQSLIDLL